LQSSLGRLNAALQVLTLISSIPPELRDSYSGKKVRLCNAALNSNIWDAAHLSGVVCKCRLAMSLPSVLIAFPHNLRLQPPRIAFLLSIVFECLKALCRSCPTSLKRSPYYDRGSPGTWVLRRRAIRRTEDLSYINGTSLPVSLFWFTRQRSVIACGPITARCWGLGSLLLCV
jgi:hypothetical protein